MSCMPPLFYWGLGSIGQRLSPRFRGQRYDQQSQGEGHRGPGNRGAQRAGSVDGPSQDEIHASADETADGCGHSKGGGTDRRAVLLRQPETVDREVAAEESEKEEQG